MVADRPPERHGAQRGHRRDLGLADSCRNGNGHGHTERRARRRPRHAGLRAQDRMPRPRSRPPRRSRRGRRPLPTRRRSRRRAAPRRSRGSRPDCPRDSRSTPRTGIIAGTPTATGTSVSRSRSPTPRARPRRRQASRSSIAAQPTISSVTLANVSGGTAGRVEKGDTIKIVFSAAMDVSTICSTWTTDTSNQSLTADNAGDRDAHRRDQGHDLRHELDVHVQLRPARPRRGHVRHERQRGVRRSGHATSRRSRGRSATKTLLITLGAKGATGHRRNRRHEHARIHARPDARHGRRLVLAVHPSPRERSSDALETSEPHPGWATEVGPAGLGLRLGRARSASRVSTVLSLRPLVSGGSEVRQVRRDDLALQRASDLRVTLAEWQVYIEPHIATFSTLPLAVDPVDLASGSKLAETEIARSQVAERHRCERSGFRSRLAISSRSQAAFTTSLAAIAPMAAGSPDDGQSAGRGRRARRVHAALAADRDHLDDGSRR